MSDAYCRLLASLDELHAASHACLTVQGESAELRDAFAAATLRADQAYAAWLHSGEQASTQQGWTILAEISEINRLSLMIQDRRYALALKPVG
jgi:hypothetical protein